MTSVTLHSSLAPLPFRQSRGILYGPSQPPHPEGTMKYSSTQRSSTCWQPLSARPTASNSLAVSEQAAEPNHCESRDPVPSVVRGSFVVKFLLAPVVCTCVSASARQSRALCCVGEFCCKILVGFQSLSLVVCRRGSYQEYSLTHASKSHHSSHVYFALLSFLL